MEAHMRPLLYLLLCMNCVVQGDNDKRFLITAPSVFHVGVKEPIWIQVGEALLGKPVSCQLETEMRIPMSTKEIKTISKKGQFEAVKLEIFENEVSNLKSINGEPPYLNLACEVDGQKRQTRVLVSKHSGYIFIQTDQPIYNPTQKVWFRIFTLDHSMRPKSEIVYVSIYNADGNKIKKSMYNVLGGGILLNSYHIPDVSKPGVWKITAHYKGDEKNPAIREFKVQKFVLPSFGVSVQSEKAFLLVKAETFTFTIQASYTYGKEIDGGYHCRFGIKKDESENNPGEIEFIKGLEKTGSVKRGRAGITVKISDINQKLNSTLDDLAATKTQFYIAVTVTDILSGEVQESTAFIPIVLSPFNVDLSRTRLFYTPKYPLQAVVTVHHPNGSPAEGVQVNLDVSSTKEQSIKVTTNEEGIAFHSFNLEGTPSSILMQATVDGVKLTRELRPVKSTKNSFLYLSVTNKVMSSGESLDVTFYVSGNPVDGQIYYMIVSRGMLRTASSVASGSTVKISIGISPEMIPSFRVISFYYDTDGDIIADSVWVDVENRCEGKLEIKLNGNHNYQPDDSAELDIDVGTQNAKVALLVVDKAIYALGSQNKLTPKQVFTSMQSYDLGCSYGGGENTAAVFNDAGLAFISHSTTIRSMMRKGFSCESGFRRNKRSTDIQTEMAKKEAKFKKAELQKCCRHGFTLIPMKFSCEDRAKRVSKTESKDCVEVFRECCEFAAKLRDKKRREDLKKGHGRTADSNEDEEFFDFDIQSTRRYFPPSFEFKQIDVKGKVKHTIYLPHSITTWEIQALSLSASHGFCVTEPLDLLVFKPVFISLRLPYSVKRFEQLSIVVVIFNYGKLKRELVVQMKKVDGLCSPGSASSSSTVRISLEQQSSQTVTFPAVPMVTGEIPITIALYEDEEEKISVDAIQKMLLVKNEGVEMREEKTYFINLNGRSDQRLFIDGSFPNSTVPETDVNLFVKLEEVVFVQSTAVPLLSPSKVENLIRAPKGCGEQTMIFMSPTALSIRYLDKSQNWLELEAGFRDKALDFIEQAYDRILTFKKRDGSYGAWLDHPTSTWLTALVVKVLSIVADRQIETLEQQGKTERLISQEDIRQAVTYLIGTQSSDGSFTDANPVIHREMQGGIGGVEQDASLTAFITIALKHSLPFLDKERTNVESSISRATDFLLKRVDDLKRPYALSITAYCLSTCLADRTQAMSAWRKLRSLAKPVGECLVWQDYDDLRLVSEAKISRVPPGMALTVETTAYALMTALEQNDFITAHAATCYLSSQENYEGGFKSTQDTIMALEALSEYALKIPETPITTVNAQFTVSGRSEMEKLLLEKNENKVETELKRLVGRGIDVSLSGEGKVKMKVAKAYYALKEESNCADLSITVTVEGKVEYTTEVQQTYNYYEDYEQEEKREEEEDLPHSGIEWFDARSRQRRDTTQNMQNDVVYTVCVRHTQGRNLSGMAIADITLLSGFDAINTDLEKLKDLVDRYISHYELTRGRVLLYFNEIEEGEACIAFGAKQSVPIGLVQPAPATFYDYYEPDRRCSVLYSAPKRSNMVSLLCSDDVCQCAERGCFTEKKTIEMEIHKKDRLDYACYHSNIDYALEVKVDSVSEESNFILYLTSVNVVLRNMGDLDVNPGSTRVFAKRKHCKGELKEGETYLIMGNDGPTKDLSGNMQYLLDSKTWVEQRLSTSICKASVNRIYCKELKDFVKQYQVDGCNV
ncbi:complement C4-B [Pimephales promelas]|uniref:complement C4-B n=1 Tax=Pimephales promelas TaxID=90988 RepID=UPI001955F1C9|nr:complement C4-B [Pimephales promelas]